MATIVDRPGRRAPVDQGGRRSFGGPGPAGIRPDWGQGSWGLAVNRLPGGKARPWADPTPSTSIEGGGAASRPAAAGGPGTPEGPSPAGSGRLGRGRLAGGPGVVVTIRIIAVGGVLALDAVDHDAEDRDARGGELAVGPLDQRHPAGVEPGGHHRAVGPAAHDQGVGHRQDRRGVDDHQVVLLAEPAEQLAEPGRLQDPAGVAARAPRPRGSGTRRPGP